MLTNASMPHFKAKQPRALLENIMATHHLELVYLDYLCLDLGRVQVENILVVRHHFTQYTKEFLLETNASKEGLEAVLAQKQVDG